MTTITLEVPDDLAGTLKQFEPTILIEILRKVIRSWVLYHKPSAPIEQIVNVPLPNRRTLAKYKGVFNGRGGNMSFEAIEQTLNEAKVNHLNKLLGEMA